MAPRNADGNVDRTMPAVSVAVVARSNPLLDLSMGRFGITGQQEIQFQESASGGVCESRIDTDEREAARFARIEYFSEEGLTVIGSVESRLDL